LDDILLYCGVGAVFFVIGFIASISKSAKGSSIIQVLMGLVVGGAGGILIGGGAIQGVEPTKATFGISLLAIAIGLFLGILLGVKLKLHWTKTYPKEVKNGLPGFMNIMVAKGDITEVKKDEDKK